jgi:hypothetical protein
MSIHDSLREALLDGVDPDETVWIHLESRWLMEHVNSPSCWCHPVPLTGVHEIEAYIQTLQADGNPGVSLAA